MQILENKSLFQQSAFINGEWVEAESQDRVIVTNPATNEEIGSVPNMGRIEALEAVESSEPPRLYRRVFYLSQAAMPDRVKLS